MFKELLAHGVNYRTAYRRVKEHFKNMEHAIEYEYSTGEWV